ncbi:MAG: M15 family metallopeptidase [Bacteroidia bacterium]|jgi:D-alanyl-D-alanine carboxypeptidase
MVISKDWLLGKINPATHPEFVEVPLHLCDEPGHYLLKPVLDAWVKLYALAEDEGIELKIISSTRTFERQKAIWENKWFGRTLTNGIDLSKTAYNDEEKATEILKYSAMPGTSRHHWGTDLDFNSVENDYFKTDKGFREYIWMKLSAENYGFCRPYCDLTSRNNKGYQEEQWHWSFFPLSRTFRKAYLNAVEYADISGFEGSHTAPTLHIFEDYVDGISNKCR